MPQFSPFKSSWLRRRFKSPASPHCRLQLESLEDRVVLSYGPVLDDVLVNGPNLTTIGEQSHAAVAPALQGNFVVAWQSEEANGNRINLRSYSADGVPRNTSPLNVESLDYGNQYDPSLGWNSTKGMVTWQVDRADGAGNDIYVRRINSNGDAEGSSIRVNDSPGNFSNPVVELSESGDFVVAWESEGPSGTDILARRFNAAGNPKGPLFQVNPASDGVHENPSIAATAGNGFVIVFQERSESASNYDVVARRFDSAGAPIGSSFQVASSVVGDQKLPVVASDLSGNVAIAWESDHASSGDFDIYMQRYSSAWDQIGSETLVNLTTPNSQTNPSITIDAAQNIFVAWQSSTQDGSGLGIYARRLGFASASTSEEFLVNNKTVGDQFGPSIAISTVGDAIVAFNGNDQGESPDVYFRRMGENSPRTAPTASAGSNYTIIAGSKLTLNASGTSVEPGAILHYSWDLNGDGVFGDIVSNDKQVVVLWRSDYSTSLESLGFTATPGSRSIRVMVSDQYGISTISAPVILTVNANKTPTIATNGPYTLEEQGSVLVSPTFSTGSGESGQDYKVEWDLNGDGNYADWTQINSTNGSGNGTSAYLNWSTFVAVGWNHTYGTRTIRAKITDVFGLTAISTTTLNIIPNIIPAANAGGPYTVMPGHALTLNGGNTTNLSDVAQYSWDINGDGVYGDIVKTGSSNYQATLTWQQLVALGIGTNPRNYNVSVKITDQIGSVNISPVTTLSIVPEPAPTITVYGPYSIQPGTSFQLSAKGISDLNGNLTYSWDLNGDGVFGDLLSTAYPPGNYSATVTWNQLSASGVTLDPQTLNISVKVTDPYGVSAISPTTTLTILPNQQPILNANGGLTVIQGLELSGNQFYTSDQQILTRSWDINGDGVFGDYVSTSNTIPWSAIVAAGLGVPGTSNISLKVSDGFGGLATATTTLTIVADRPPIANAGTSYSIFQDGYINLNASLSSDPDGESLEYYWDINDDGVFEDAFSRHVGFLWSTLQSFGIYPGDVNVYVKVVDAFGLSSISPPAVLHVIPNHPPVATANGAYSVLPGGVITLSAAGSSDPDSQSLTYSWDVNGDGNFGDATGVSPTLTWSQLGLLGIATSLDTRSVRVRATDSMGLSTVSNPTTLTVAATGPSSGGGPYSIVQGGTLFLNAGYPSGTNSTNNIQFSWDLNGDGVYGDAVGPTAAVAWEQLSALGIGSTPEVRNIRVRTTDVTGAIATSDPVALTITPNGVPTATTGGPYHLIAGHSLVLNASGSVDPDGQTLTYAWDINGDGSFTDATGVSPMLSWAALRALGLMGLDSRDIRVKVSDTAGALITSAASQLNIDGPLTTTVDTGGPYTILRGAGLRLDASGTVDSSGATITKYEWDLNGDGIFSDVVSTNPVVIVSPLTLGSLKINTQPNVYGIQLRATNSFGDVLYSETTTLTVMTNNAATPTLVGTFTSPVIRWVVNNHAIITGTQSSVPAMWATDGTSQGTIKLPVTMAVSGIASGNYYYFTGTSENRSQLWRTDGTVAGTIMLKDIYAGTGSPMLSDFCDVNGTLYFTAYSNTYGRNIWKSDGTSAGTVQASDVTQGTAGININSLISIGSQLYFINNDYIWSSDGTFAGSANLGVKAIQLFNSKGTLTFYQYDETLPGSNINYRTLDRIITPVPNTGALFAPHTEIGPDAYAISTVSGSVVTSTLYGLGQPIQVYDYAQPAMSIRDGFAVITKSGLAYATSDSIEAILPALRLSWLMPVGNRLYFSSYSSTGPEGDPLGSELWTSDGTSSGTFRLLDLAPGTASSTPVNLTPFNDKLAFVSGSNVYVVDPNAVQLTAPVNQTVSEGSAVSFTADTKGRGITFSLAAGAPEGATIDPITGLFVWVPDDNYAQPVSITIVATGLSGAVDAKTFTVTVTSTAPSLHVTAPISSVLRGEIVSFTLLPNDAGSADMAGTFSYLIDWDGDGVQDQSITGNAGIVVRHAFAQPGSQTLHFIVIDKDGVPSSVVTQTITVDAWRMVPDSSNPTLTNLIWSGTPGNDSISFTYTGPNQITVTTTLLNGVATSSTQVFDGVTGHLIAYGQQGDDRLDASIVTGHMVELRGNGGNDTIIGGDSSDLLYGDSDGGEGGNDSIVAGNGNDVVYADGPEGKNDTVSGGIGDDEIFSDPIQGAEGSADLVDGGDGNDLIDTGIGADTITGASGNDVLIAGKNADSITGGSGQDLIITSGLAISFYASGGAGLQQLWNQWRTSDPIANRIAFLSGAPGGIISPSFILSPGSNVTNDSAIDTVVADDDVDNDWILADASQDVLHQTIDDYFTDL